MKNFEKNICSQYFERPKHAKTFSQLVIKFPSKFIAVSD